MANTLKYAINQNKARREQEQKPKGTNGKQVDLNSMRSIITLNIKGQIHQLKGRNLKAR